MWLKIFLVSCLALASGAEMEISVLPILDVDCLLDLDGETQCFVLSERCLGQDMNLDATVDVELVQRARRNSASIENSKGLELSSGSIKPIRGGRRYLTWRKITGKK